MSLIAPANNTNRQVAVTGEFIAGSTFARNMYRTKEWRQNTTIKNWLTMPNHKGALSWRFGCIFSQNDVLKCLAKHPRSYTKYAYNTKTKKLSELLKVEQTVIGSFSNNTRNEFENVCPKFSILDLNTRVCVTHCRNPLTRPLLLDFPWC